MRCKNCIHLDVCYEHDIIGADDNGMCTSYEPDRPHGEWRECEVSNIFGETMKAYECANCKRKNIGDVWIMMKLQFCPNCGADMRKGGN